MKGDKDFESQYGIGEVVSVLCRTTGTVVAVRFTTNKITYDIRLQRGGEVMCNVDSAFVTPITKTVAPSKPAPIKVPKTDLKSIVASQLT